MTRFAQVFGAKKPVIAMVHLGAMPGTPLHDAEAGIEGIIAGAAADLAALQAAGFDAVMFGNENDRPYELRVDPASTVTMAGLCALMLCAIRNAAYTAPGNGTESSTTRGGAGLALCSTCVPTLGGLWTGVSSVSIAGCAFS